MNWKQFKDAVESQGVTDDMKIHGIQIMNYTLERNQLRVSIYPGYSKYSPKEILII